MRCPNCNGTGFAHVVRLIRGVKYDASEPCTCRPAFPVEEKVSDKSGQLKKPAMQTVGDWMNERDVK